MIIREKAYPRAALIGTYREDTFDDMRCEMKKYDVEVIKPEIVR